ncbi:ABC transporter permease subunit [Paenibacillus sp. LMG 31460]|uniref:ABC transporter permease subunit n=1 Tax=Paenibacillus germinis TaxID=2654979 RepID=A0ABX1ZBP0_9BACL|nr:ABC transporter permease subunit [Paenibacillus germinis]
MYIIVQFIRTLPRELYKAATVDGCGPITIYTRIILPLTSHRHYNVILSKVLRRLESNKVISIKTRK